MAMEGHKLMQTLAELTGLPGESVNRELAKLVEAHGATPETLTMDDVREILASYLQDILLDAKRELAAFSD